MYLSLILFAINLLGLGVNLNAFAFQNLTREKSRGIIQSLLATPLNEKKVWLGKSLAIFLPGLMLGELLTLIGFVTINYLFFVPKMGFIINPWIIVSSFVAVPLTYLSLTLLVYLIGLTSKPANGNVISIIFLPLIITLVINLVLRSGLNAGGWIFTLINFGIAVVIGTISLILQPLLTKERIMMSN
jgi:ABC-type Na+ efflux pump permease subunit